MNNPRIEVSGDKSPRPMAYYHLYRKAGSKGAPNRFEEEKTPNLPT